MSKIDTFYSKLKDYGYIETIDLTRETGIGSDGKYDILIILTKQIHVSECDKIKITFWNCSQIKMGDIDGFLSPTFTIEDITSRQLEKLNYKISEIENSTFSFLCSDFEFEII